MKLPLQPLNQLFVLRRHLWSHNSALKRNIEHCLAFHLPSSVCQAGHELVQLPSKVILYTIRPGGVLVKHRNIDPRHNAEQSLDVSTRDGSVQNVTKERVDRKARDILLLQKVNQFVNRTARNAEVKCESVDAVYVDD